MEDPTILIAFSAGLASFIAPCILPMIPAFLAYISGTTLTEINNDQKTNFKINNKVNAYSVTHCDAIINDNIRTIKNSLPNYLNVQFHSMIVFYGDCKLKKISKVPSDVLVVKSNNAIDTFNDILVKSPSTNFYTKEVVTVLKKGVENGNYLKIQNVHIENTGNFTK